MRRSIEFQAFLRSRKKSAAYLRYCENIEKAFGGMDMDEIVSSHQTISKVRAKLEKTYFSKKSVDNYMSGLNRYLEFVVSAATTVSGPAAAATATVPGGETPLYHVARGKGVPLSSETTLVARTLEQEYMPIVQFAKKLLKHGSFEYIPVILSDEMPMQDCPGGGEPVLGRFFSSEKPYIEIYYRNGDPHDPARFRKCLAHEYLHYLHFAYAGDAFSKAKKELKEALADFFGVLYAIYRHGKDDLAAAKSRYASWKKHFGTYWPYASALHFYRVGGCEMAYSSELSDYCAHGSIGKFVQIFFGTDRPDEAYKSLLE